MILSNTFLIPFQAREVGSSGLMILFQQREVRVKTIHQPASLPSTSAFSGGSAISTKLDMPHSKNHMKRGENGRGYWSTVPIVSMPRDVIEMKCQAFYPLEIFQHLMTCYTFACRFKEDSAS